MEGRVLGGSCGRVLWEGLVGGSCGRVFGRGGGVWGRGGGRETGGRGRGDEEKGENGGEGGIGCFYFGVRQRLGGSWFSFGRDGGGVAKFPGNQLLLGLSSIVLVQLLSPWPSSAESHNPVLCDDCHAFPAKNRSCLSGRWFPSIFETWALFVLEFRMNGVTRQVKSPEFGMCTHAPGEAVNTPRAQCTVHTLHRAGECAAATSRSSDGGGRCRAPSDAAVGQPAVLFEPGGLIAVG